MTRVYSAIFFCVLYLSSSAQITVTSNTNSIGAFDIYELTISHNQSTYSNVWEAANITCIFANGGISDTISGFYYNTDTWKVRYAPGTVGTWSYSLSFADSSNVYTSTGSVNCIASLNKGFLRKHPDNNFRFVYSLNG